MQSNTDFLIPSELLESKEELAKWTVETYAFFVEQVERCVQTFSPIWIVESFTRENKQKYLDFKAEQESKLSDAVKGVLTKEGQLNPKAASTVSDLLKKQFAQKLLIERVLVNRGLVAEQLLKNSLYKQVLEAIRAEVAGQRLYVTISEAVHISVMDIERRAFRMISLLVGVLGTQRKDQVFLINCKHIKSGERVDKSFYVNLFLESMVSLFLFDDFTNLTLFYPLAESSLARQPQILDRSRAGPGYRMDCRSTG